MCVDVSQAQESASLQAQEFTSVHDGWWTDEPTWGFALGTEMYPQDSADVVVIKHEVESSAAVSKALTIEPGATLLDAAGITVLGDVVNHGSIEEGWIIIGGDLINTGEWKPWQIRFDDPGSHKISSEALGIPIEMSGQLIAGMAGADAGAITFTAESPLVFSGEFVDLGRGVSDEGAVLHMRAHPLTVKFLHSGTVTQAEYIEAYDDDSILGPELILDDAHSIIRGNFVVNGVVNAPGDLTLEGTLELDSLGFSQLEVGGTFRNEGALTRTSPDDGMTVVVGGNIINEGDWDIWKLILAGEGERTFKGKNIYADLTQVRDSILFVGESRLPRLSLLSFAYARVGAGDSLFLERGPLEVPFSGIFANEGLVSVALATDDHDELQGFHQAWVAGLNEVQGVDSIIVETYGNQTPSSFPQSTMTWWNVRLQGDSIDAMLPELILWAGEDSLLNDNNPDELEFFHSEDGTTWAKISTDTTRIRRPFGGSSMLLRDAPPGFYALSDASDATASEDKEIPRRYSLEQNYPNPFNPQTTIHFELPQPERVVLEVFDALGRRVDVLVDKKLPAGEHAARFDASHLSSGIYLYRIQAGSFRRAMQMVVLQ